MTQHRLPRFHSGGYAGHGDPRMAARRIDSFAVDDLNLGAEGAELMRRVIESSSREALARAVALDLIRVHGVTLSLRTLRARPRPLHWIELMVLEKLEAVSVHLGAP